MILVDFRQIVIANAMILINKENIDLDEGIVRHFVLNSIRNFRQKFHREYGELVICLEGRSWRYKEFPHYKHGRKKDDKIDWESIDKWVKMMAVELATFFPYPVVRYEDAEADDIIGVLCHTSSPDEPILIVSGDKDFVQLQTLPNVRQYNPVRGEMVVELDPKGYLFESIIRGCSTDKIPNIKSPTDIHTIEGKRQKPIHQVFVAECRKTGIPQEFQKRFSENEKLIDLSKIPDDVKNGILYKYQVAIDRANANGRKNIYNYMVGKKLVNLLTDMKDF